VIVGRARQFSRLAQFALEDLRMGDRTPQQAGEQEKRGFEHASLHELRGAGGENLLKRLIQTRASIPANVRHRGPFVDC
jgi:hypothetical protein